MYKEKRMFVLVLWHLPKSQGQDVRVLQQVTAPVHRAQHTDQVALRTSVQPPEPAPPALTPLPAAAAGAAAAGCVFRSSSTAAASANTARLAGGAAESQLCCRATSRSSGGASAASQWAERS